VLFYPFDVGNKPTVLPGEKTVVVEGFDPILQEPVRLDADRVVLATGLAPADHTTTCQVFGVTETRDGFLAEADAKWRPVDSGREGVFICGLARAPMNAEEAMQEGRAAAVRALRLLNRTELGAHLVAARVRRALCSKCEACIAACPYHARYLDTERQQVSVDVSACQGCGTCAAVCPNSATIVGGFEEAGILEAIEMAL
jgi:heterodisulfide reductase subunit A